MLCCGMLTSCFICALLQDGMPSSMDAELGTVAMVRSCLMADRPMMMPHALAVRRCVPWIWCVVSICNGTASTRQFARELSHGWILFGQQEPDARCKMLSMWQQQQRASFIYRGSFVTRRRRVAIFVIATVHLSFPVSVSSHELH